MDLKDVIWEREGGVVTLTMNRPKKLNAQSMDMMESLVAAFEEIERDDEIKCAIWTGAGRAWSSGRDFSDPKLAGAAPYGPEFPRGTRLLPLSLGGRLQYALWRCRKPIIVAVNGHMLGGAFSAGLMGDFRIASDRAQLGAIFVRRGRVPDNGGIYMLVKIMGLGPALEFMYSGDIVDAAAAKELYRRADLLALRGLDVRPGGRVRRRRAVLHQLWEPGRRSLAVSRGARLRHPRRCTEEA